MRIRKGDQVVVISGDDAGPTPHPIMSVLEGGRRVLVQGVNRAYKHVKKGHPRSPQGGRLSLEMPIATSNVQYYCAACKQGVRLGVRVTADGRKERFCKKCSAACGTVGAAKANRTAAKAK